MSTSVAPPSASTVAPRRPRGARIAGIVLAILAGIAVLGFFVRARHSGPSPAASASAAAAARVVSVTTVKVTREDVPVWLEGLGNVSAFLTVTVKPQVDGRLDKVLFKEGQSVKKGDVLAQIDPRPFAIQLESAQAALARDKANLKNAQVNVERYTALSQDNLIPQQQLTDQQATAAQLAAQVTGDQAQIDAARLNLDYARITSPIDGVTGVRLVDQGNVVHAADPSGLVVVTQLDPIAVFFTLPEDQLPSVREAMSGDALLVEARSRDGGKVLGQGKLSVIDNQINQATATVRLKAIFDNPDHRLWPNQFVKARLKLGTRQNALVVPAAVVQHGPQGTFAYVVGADDTADVRPLKVLTMEGELALIESGLAEGETVVVSGQAQLRPHAKVSAKAQAPEAAAGRSGATGASTVAASAAVSAEAARGAEPAKNASPPGVPGPKRRQSAGSAK
jgi:multidrug efflux system membrane fusion protein